MAEPHKLPVLTHFKRQASDRSGFSKMVDCRLFARKHPVLDEKNIGGRLGFKH